MMWSVRDGSAMEGQDGSAVSAGIVEYCASTIMEMKLLGLPLGQVFGSLLREEGAGTVSYQKNKTGVHTELVIALRRNIGQPKFPCATTRQSVPGDKEVCMGHDLSLHSIYLI